MAIKGGDGSIVLTTEVDESGINKGFSAIKSGASKVAKGFAVVGAAAATAFTAISAAAVNSYAEYEQLAGGVETLFKDSSNKLIGYADQAYKTAGLSANEYMATVTSFSASLLQSLGGDTDKSADYANQAIIDMSDNANKMGTSMEMIQNAYQGFAKQNYTMLDNLKLGYGGTKEEMQRLLEDATKLSGIEYDISSFADVTQAIHVIQSNLGITGTTAKEASTTIQGSFASMKSAWQNLLTGMADENQNFDVLLNNFIDSIGTVLNNLLPRISVVLGGVVKLVKGLLPQIPKILQQLLPMLIDGTTTIIQGIANILPDLITTILNVLPQLMETIIALFPTLLPILIDGVFMLILGIINAMNLIIDPIIKILPDLIVNILDALIKNLPLLIEGLISLILGIVKALPQIIKALVDAMPTIIDLLLVALFDNIPLIISGLVKVVAQIVIAVPQIFSSMVKAVVSVFAGMWEGIKESAKLAINFIIGIINGLIGGFEGFINIFAKGINLIVSGLNQISFDIPDWVPLIGGQKFGFNIPKMKEASLKRIPKLAQGAVIPPNREFLAVLGDQKSGVNIETPLQTMVDAFNIALSQNGGARGNTTVILEVDRRELGRVTYEANNEERRRIGLSFAKGGAY